MNCACVPTICFLSLCRRTKGEVTYPIKKKSMWPWVSDKQVRSFSLSEAGAEKGYVINGVNGSGTPTRANITSELI